MSTNKKYFYMRLKEDFFRSPELIAVESMPNGYQYSNILLKLYLLSLRGNGRIMAGAIPYSPEMIARATGHDCETVNEAIALFSDVGLIEKLDSGAIYMLALFCLARDCARGMGTTLRAWDEMIGVANYCSGRGGSGNRRTTPGVTLSMGEWWEQLSGEIIENF